jgi:hypothetical protein
LPYLYRVVILLVKRCLLVVIFETAEKKRRMDAVSYLSYIGTCTDSVPRMNLGARWTTADDEDQFAVAFTQAYDRKYPWLHSGTRKLNRIMVREVPVNGFGIPDLVTVSWDPSISALQRSHFEAELRPTVRAFEFKLSDWRKGLMQAHRYRFFSDVAMLVVPAAKLILIKPFLQTFRKINVGLWGFNEIKGSISMILTPRPRMPADRERREKVIGRLLDTARQAPPSP